jgi:hypothetical protein
VTSSECSDMLFCKDVRARARARSLVRGTACAARCCRRRDYCSSSPSLSLSSSPTIRVPPLFLFHSCILYCFLAPSSPCPHYLSITVGGFISYTCIGVVFLYVRALYGPSREIQQKRNTRNTGEKKQ